MRFFCSHFTFSCCLFFLHLTFFFAPFLGVPVLSQSSNTHDKTLACSYPPIPHPTHSTSMAACHVILGTRIKEPKTPEGGQEIGGKTHNPKKKSMITNPLGPTTHNRLRTTLSVKRITARWSGVQLCKKQMPCEPGASRARMHLYPS